MLIELFRSMFPCPLEYSWRNHRQFRLGQSMSWSRFEPATVLIQGQSVTTRTCSVIFSLVNRVWD